MKWRLTWPPGNELQLLSQVKRYRILCCVICGCKPTCQVAHIQVHKKKVWGRKSKVAVARRTIQMNKERERGVGWLSLGILMEQMFITHLPFEYANLKNHLHFTLTAIKFQPNTSSVSLMWPPTLHITCGITVQPLLIGHKLYCTYWIVCACLFSNVKLVSLRISQNDHLNSTDNKASKRCYTGRCKHVALLIVQMHIEKDKCVCQTNIQSLPEPVVFCSQNERKSCDCSPFGVKAKRLTRPRPPAVGRAICFGFFFPFTNK